jgi:hypothetical protein
MLEDTLHFLYAGKLLPGGEALSPDHLFGLLANSKYLLCDSLTKLCLERLRHYVDARDSRYFNHPGFGPQLVPHDFILSYTQTAMQQSVHAQTAVPAVYVNIPHSWIEHHDSQWPGASN